MRDENPLLIGRNMAARVLLIVFAASPLIVFVVMSVIHLWRRGNETQREVDELRTIVQKSEDDRPWNTVLQNIEDDKTPYGTPPKERNN